MTKAFRDKQPCTYWRRVRAPSLPVRVEVVMFPLQSMSEGATSGIAHLIQTALTPVFLLSGIGQLLQVFNARLTTVSDHMLHAADLLNADPPVPEKQLLMSHLARFSHRIWLLYAAIALGAVGGASACAAASVLFLGSLRNSSVADWLIGLFALALGCTVASLTVFLGDSVLAWSGLWREGHLSKSLYSLQSDYGAITAQSTGDTSSAKILETP